MGAVVYADKQEQYVRTEGKSVRLPAFFEVAHRVSGDAPVHAFKTVRPFRRQLSRDHIGPRMPDLMVEIPAGGFVLIPVAVRDGIALKQDLHLETPF